MKHSRFAFAASVAIPLAMLSACGDEVTEVTQVTEVKQVPITMVSSENDLPDCGGDIDGSFVIAKDKQKVFVCYSEKWYTLNALDGSSEGKTGTDGKNGTNGSNGKNGSNGNDGSDGKDGASCTGVAFESGDSTGFKIVCGTDTLGVILNGKDGVDGADGKNGRHGLVPGLAKKLAKRMKRGINIDFFANEVKDFSNFDDDGLVDKSFKIYLHDKFYAYDEIRKTHFEEIAKVGFDHVRIQVRWENHYEGDSSKCKIDPEYMKQIKWAVENSIANGLIAVVNEHYLAYLQTDDKWDRGNGYSYKQISPCLKSLYGQIAKAMSGYSTDSLIVELPNEPNKEPEISAKQWNGLADSLIQIVHKVDPARVIIVGPRDYYSKDYLNELQLDNSDGLLMASFHYYAPVSFTIDNTGEKSWAGTESQKKSIYNDFEQVAEWSKAHGNIPIYLGEYGTNCNVTDTAAVEKWLTAITQIADHFGFATAMHEFAGTFFAYSLKNKKWLDYKLRALFKPKESFVVPDRPDLDTLSKKVVVEDFEDDFPICALSKALDEEKEWFFSNSCKGASCDTVVTTNAEGEKFGTVELASFKIDQGHTGSALYMKNETKALKDVYPYWGLQTDFANGSIAYDLSEMKAVSFWAKGVGKIKMVLHTNYSDSVATANGSWTAGFCGEFDLTSEWRRYVVWSDQLFPEQFSKLDSLGGVWDKAKDRVYKIEFKYGADVTANKKSTVEWYLDDITLYGISLSDFE